MVSRLVFVIVRTVAFQISSLAGVVSFVETSARIKLSRFPFTLSVTGMMVVVMVSVFLSLVRIIVQRSVLDWHCSGINESVKMLGDAIVASPFILFVRYASSILIIVPCT